MSREPRLRDYLTREEVAALLRAAKKSPRHAACNHAMILAFTAPQPWAPTR
jgi:integrase